MEPEIVLRKITGTAPDLIDLGLSSTPELYPSSYTFSVAFYSYGLYHQPVVFVAAFIAQKSRNIVQIQDEYVQVPIVVVVSEGNSSTNLFDVQSLSRNFGYIGECAVSQILKELVGLGIADT